MYIKKCNWFMWRIPHHRRRRRRQKRKNNQTAKHIHNSHTFDLCFTWKLICEGTWMGSLNVKCYYLIFEIF